MIRDATISMAFAGLSNGKYSGKTPHAR
jgi:hypothetical protein